MQENHSTQKQALQVLQTFCNTKDRCCSEARSKLIDLGINGDQLEALISELIKGNYLNEERFARSYVKDKYKTKKRGRQRLANELKHLNIPIDSIKKALSEIDNDKYIATLKDLLTRKTAQYRLKNDDFETRKKAAIYALKQGYEQSLIWVVIHELE